MTKPKKPKAVPSVALKADFDVGAEVGAFGLMSPSEDAGKRARARGPDPDVFLVWCERIGTGSTERFAAIGLPVPYKTLRSWADRDPEGMGEQLADAHERHIQMLLNEMRDAPDAIGRSEDDGVHPTAGTLKASNAKWELGKLDRRRFGEGKIIEQELTVKEAPPDETAADVARDALALLTPAERLALAAQIAAENDVAHTGEVCDGSVHDAPSPNAPAGRKAG